MKAQKSYISVMNNQNPHSAYLQLLTETISKLDTSNLNTLTEVFYEAYQNGAQFFIFGNGGSAATASHIAGDFVKGASRGLDKRFKFICLNDNTSAMMAISNDLSYEEVFIEQLKNFMNKGDIVIGISGSGNSVNVIKAMEYAKANGAKTLAFCGYKGGKIKDIADYSLHAEVMDMEIAEDIHLVGFHTIKQALITKIHGSLQVSMGATYDQRIK